MEKCQHCEDGVMERVEHHHERLHVCGSCGVADALDNDVNLFDINNHSNTNYNVFNVTNVTDEDKKRKSGKQTATMTTRRLTTRQRRLRLLLSSSLSHFTSSSSSSSSLRQSALFLSQLAPVTKCSLEATASAILITALRNNGVNISLANVADVVRADHVEVGKVLRKLQKKIDSTDSVQKAEAFADPSRDWNSKIEVRKNIMVLEKNNNKGVVFKDKDGSITPQDFILDKVAVILDLLRLQGSLITNLCNDSKLDLVVAISFLVFKAEKLERRRKLGLIEFINDCQINQEHLSIQKIEKEVKIVLGGLRKMLQFLPFFSAPSRVTSNVILSRLRDLIDFKEAIKVDLLPPINHLSNEKSSTTVTKDRLEVESNSEVMDEMEIDSYLRTEAQIEALRPLYEAQFATKRKTSQKAVSKGIKDI